MKEILKSKVMVCFLLFIIGVCTFNAVSINNETYMESVKKQNTMVLNEK